MKMPPNLSLLLNSGGGERKSALWAGCVNHIVPSSRCMSSGLFRVELLFSFCGSAAILQVSVVFLMATTAVLTVAFLFSVG